MLDSSWGDLLRPVRPHYRMVFWNCVLCALAGLLLAMVLPKSYTARATILPPNEEQTGMSMSSLLRGLSVPGVRVPLTITPSDMVQSVLDSDRLRAAVARRCDPRRIYGIKDSLDALDRLRKKSRFKVTSLGVVEMRVEAPSAQDASDLANAYITELDQFTRTQRMSRGHRSRLFIERRLADTRVRLDSLQDMLSAFQKRHHAPATGTAPGAGLEAAARMVADRMNLQFQLDLARSYSSESSQEVGMLLARLSALDKELDRLPPVGMEMSRLMRDLKAYEQSFAFLTAQYEDARIEEARDLVTVDVLDPAVPPRKASFPRKRFFVAGALAIGLMGSLGWIALGAPGSRKTEGPGPA